MTTTSPDHDITIIGAGFSGIGIAVSLMDAGFTDLQLIEEGEDFGGTWYWNRYPGIAVDIPSYSYEYSFAPHDDWSRTYAPGRELLRYARQVADEHRLRERARFGERVTSAVFDEDADAWTVTTSNETFTTRTLIDATGVLTMPKTPEIPGVESFAGRTVHTARWEDDVELAGKRVAIIGTGASAIQVIPEIAPIVEQLTVFQRTPIWCLPKSDYALPERVRKTMRRLPLAHRAARALSQAYVEATFVIPAHWNRQLHVTKLIERTGRSYIRKQVHDPVLQEKLTPQYGLGCKRPSFHNSYLKTYNRANVTLETDPIAEIVPEGIRTESGTLHEIDVLILATGFKVWDPGNFPKFTVTGTDGGDLEAWWRTNRYRTYEGTSMPGFPNYFLMFGPYGYNGASYFTLIEAQAQHITRCLSHARSRAATRVEITPGAADRYFAEMMKKRVNQVFWQDSCSLANSYYFSADGDVPLRPALTMQVAKRSKSYPLSDYALR